MATDGIGGPADTRRPASFHHLGTAAPQSRRGLAATDLRLILGVRRVLPLGAVVADANNGRRGIVLVLQV